MNKSRLQWSCGSDSQVCTIDPHRETSIGVECKELLITYTIFFVALKGRGRGLIIELEPEEQGTVLFLEVGLCCRSCNFFCKDMLDNKNVN